MGRDARENRVAESEDYLGAVHVAWPLRPLQGGKSGVSGLRGGLQGIRILAGKDGPRCLYKRAQKTMTVENICLSSP